MKILNIKRLLSIFWLLVVGLIIILLFSWFKPIPVETKVESLTTSGKLLNQDFNLWLDDGKVYHKNCEGVVTPVDVDYKNIKYYHFFFRDNDNVWVSNWGFGKDKDGICLPPLKLKTTPPIDPLSFTVLPSPTMFWAKDKFGLIYENERVSGFEMPFETFNQPYIKKNNKFYILTNLVELTIEPIPTLPSTVNKFFSEYYATDGMDVYHIDPYQTKRATKLDNANPLGFKQLLLGYWTDGQNIYYTHYKLVDASPNDFHSIDGDYFGNSRHVYWRENIISNVAYSNFKRIKPDSTLDSCGTDYWTDGVTIFYEGKNLQINYQKANKPTFIWSGPGRCAWIGYVWDDIRANYYGKELKDADLQTFKVLARDIARDNKHFYIAGEIWPGDPNLLEKDYAEGKLNSILYSNLEAY